MSYGFTKNYPELHKKIKEAHGKGIITQSSAEIVSSTLPLP
jgi:hypothetical protein